MPPNHDAIEFWVKGLGLIGALIALTVTWRAHTERTSFEMIDRLYALCHALEAHLLRDWYLAHLLCIGVDEYDATTARIRKYVEREPHRLEEFITKERLFAIHIFIVYEQVFYQLKNTSRFLHRRRRRFLTEMLAYFAERLLHNPRLLAMLEADPTGASLHLEPISKRFIDRKILPLTGKAIDRNGPFVSLEPIT